MRCQDENKSQRQDQIEQESDTWRSNGVLGLKVEKESFLERDNEKKKKEEGKVAKI